MLRSDSLFWVERPRIGAGGVSGVGTLVSGAYVAISPGVGDESAYQFSGLEIPPVTSPTTPGLRLSLTSSGNKPVRVGNPVIYRGFQVGRVEQSTFDTSSRSAQYEVFIDSPYDDLVTTNTYFWNVGVKYNKEIPKYQSTGSEYCNYQDDYNWSNLEDWTG